MSRTFNSVSEIVAAVSDGDRRGASLLYSLLKQSCLPTVKSYILKRGGNDEDVDDKFQDAVLVVIDAIQQKKFRIRAISQRSGTGQLCAYTMQVVKNLWKKELSWRNRPLLQVDNVEPVHFDLFTGMIAEKFEFLDEGCREVLQQYFLLQKSPRVIAREKRWSTEDTKKRLSACIESLLRDVGQLMQEGFTDQLNGVIKESLDNIETRCKTLLTLFYFEKLSMADIATSMGYANARSATEQKNKCMKHVGKQVAGQLLKL